jgi:hypothetical protein
MKLRIRLAAGEELEIESSSQDIEETKELVGNTFRSGVPANSVLEFDTLDGWGIVRVDQIAAVFGEP